jgi:hypothetical protein
VVERMDEQGEKIEGLRVALEEEREERREGVKRERELEKIVEEVIYFFTSRGGGLMGFWGDRLWELG